MLILNKEHSITSKRDTAMSKQLKFLMLASELSSRGKRKTWTRTLRAEKTSHQKAENSFRGIKSLCRGSSRCFLREIAVHFDCVVPSVWAALKQINVTLKKTTNLKEQNPEKVVEFLYILNILKDLPVVYIDETGIDRYLYRPYARAPRGEKVYEKISGLQLLQDK